MLWVADRRGLSEFRLLDMCGASLRIWLARSEGLRGSVAFPGHCVVNEGRGLKMRRGLGSEVECVLRVKRS